jgi:hypothetical protein
MRRPTSSFIRKTATVGAPRLLTTGNLRAKKGECRLLDDLAQPPAICC